MGKELKGIMPAIATICHESGEIDEVGQRALVTFCIEKGVHGLVPMVMGGEFYKFSDEERKKVLDVVIDETNGKVPVVAGASHSGTEPAVMHSKYAEDAGADAVIVMPPYFNRAESASSLYAHFEEISTAVDIPIMIQDAEDDIQIHMCSTLISKLADEFDNIKYVKTEGVNSIMKISEVRMLTADKIGLFGGDGGRKMIQEFNMGAIGFIPGAAMSELCVDIFQNLEKANDEKAKEMFDRMLTYLRFSSQYGRSWNKMEKEALRMLGVIDSSYVRQPSVPLSSIYEQELKEVLEGLALKPIT